jgi:ATP synthase, delta/epsilon subunit, beta-sandwich domain protein
MPGALTVEIVSRTGGEAWSGQAGQLTVPLADGELGILPGRQPILAIVGRGAVRIVPVDGEAFEVPVAGGFCSVSHDTVTVAADAAGDGAKDAPVSDVLAEAVDLPDIPDIED